MSSKTSVRVDRKSWQSPCFVDVVKTVADIRIASNAAGALNSLRSSTFRHGQSLPKQSALAA